MRTSRSSIPLARAVVGASALVALAACTTGGLSSTRPEPYPTPTATRRSYILTGTELPHDRMLLDVVARTWPRLVFGDLPRGELGAPTLPPDRFGVYDERGGFLGGPSYLELVRADDVREVRRLTKMEEIAKFGYGHPAGAVVLTWRSLAP